MELKQLEKEAAILRQIEALLHYDMQTQMPQSAIKQRGAAVGYATKKLHELIHSREATQLISKLSKQKNLSKKDARIVHLYKRQQDRLKAVPAKFIEEQQALVTESHEVWRKARENEDVKSFLPYLEKIVKTKKQLAKYINPNADPYDVLLDDYEEGMTAKEIDEFFAQLKPKLLDLLKRADKTRYKTITADKETQIKLTEELHNLLIPYKTRFAHGLTTHPFMTQISRDDIRVTTGIRKDIFFAHGSTIHECGHALYELQIDKQYEGSILNSGVSMGIHESQSRFFELNVCASKEFWKAFTKTFNKVTKQKFDWKTLYNTNNQITRSTVRIEGDELTYCLHIIIRYELERGLIQGKIKVKDIEKLWNQKYKEYFGKVPKKPSVGVLQDVHWSSGLFGYFPTYALGTVRAAMIHQKLKKTAWYTKDIAKLDFTRTQNWLKENIHQYGALIPPKELLQKAIGKQDNIMDYINYLEEKYV